MAAFGILGGLWWLAFRHGFASDGDPPFPLRTLMLMHLVMTGGVVAWQPRWASCCSTCTVTRPRSTAGWPRAAWRPGSWSARASRPASGDRPTAVRALGYVAIVAIAAAAGGGIDAVWFVAVLLAAVAWTALPLRGLMVRDRGGIA